MKLQILVNHYRESEETVKRLIDSIKENLEFISKKDTVEIIIASDGPDCKLSDDFISSFNLPITYFVIEHCGVLQTRNFLLDVSDADYLMFCDSDDMFASKLGLRSFFDLANSKYSDVIISPYFEEKLIDGEYYYSKINDSALRVHGKFFKRSYIINNDIRYPDELMFSGDMYFIWLSIQLTVNRAVIETPFYIWKWNPDSITRKSEFHRQETYDVVLKNYSLLADNLAKRKQTNLLNSLIGVTFMMLYINDTDASYWNGREDLRIRAEHFMAEYVTKYKIIFDTLNVDDRRRSFYTESIIYKPSFGNKGPDYIDEWIDDLLSKN